MSEPEGARLHVAPLGGGDYRLEVPSDEGGTVITLALGDAAGASGDRLQEDAATARATARYLLQRQGAEDLPSRIEIGDVLAAYPDALDRIEILVGSSASSASQ